MYARFLITISVALLAAAAVLGGFVILSRYIIVLNAFFENAETRIAEAKELREAAKSHSIVLRERQYDIARVESFFINPRKPIAFIERLEGLAHLTRNQFDFTIENTDEDQKSTLVFHLRIDGTQQSVRMMLRAIELLPYPVHVQEIIIQQTGQTISSGSSTLLTLILGVETD